jgi:hypothetical protein
MVQSVRFGAEMTFFFVIQPKSSASHDPLETILCFPETYEGVSNS